MAFHVARRSLLSLPQPLQLPLRRALPCGARMPWAWEAGGGRSKRAWGSLQAWLQFLGSSTLSLPPKGLQLQLSRVEDMLCPHL